jgi:predicted DNA-binding transcriptional regulator YafY
MTVDVADFGLLTAREQQLVDLAAERAARAVLAELHGGTQTHCNLVTAAQLADMLGVSRETVYEHANELGGKRIGNGKRGRLRFDPAVALDRWQHRPADSSAHVAAVSDRTRRGRQPAVRLLPIRG